MQTDPQNKAEFPKFTPERYAQDNWQLGSLEANDTNHGAHRSFADFIFGSLVLHFFCVNYLN